jgi:hypothetical protein
MDDDRRELVRDVGDPLAVEAKDLGRFHHRPRDGSRIHLRPDGIEAKLEFGDDSEVSAGPSHTPEEVGVLVCARLDELPIRRNEVYRQELVDREPVLTHEPADPAAECEPGKPRVSDDPGRDGESKGLCLAVELSKKDTRLGPGRSSLRVDADASHQGEVDYQSIVTHGEAGEAVTAAAHGHPEAGPARKLHRADYIGDPGAASDEIRTTVDCAVPYSSVFLVGRVIGMNDLSPKSHQQVAFARSEINRLGMKSFRSSGTHAVSFPPHEDFDPGRRHPQGPLRSLGPAADVDRSHGPE